MRIKHKYGDCMAKYADGGTVKKQGKKGGKNKKKATPDMLGSGAAARAGSTLKDKRAQQMKDLGLKDGGKPKMRPPKRPKIESPILKDAEKRGYGPGGPHTPGAKAKRKKTK